MSGAVSTIALTGHRRLPTGAPALIRAAVGELVGLHPGATWLAGGADQVAAGEVLAHSYDVAAYQRRNKRLVERADRLVAFTDGRPGGGTATTIRQAHRQKVTLLEVRP